MFMFISFVVLCASVASFSATKFHVIEGTEAEPHSRPWMLSIEKLGEHSCGAALVRTGCSANVNSSNVAVTAAHCLPRLKNYLETASRGIFIMVNAGKHNLTEVEHGQQSRKIVAVEHHPGGSKKNDIAVFKLDSPIQFSNTIKPIDLPKHEQIPDADARCSFTGWGDTDKHAGGKFPETLQALDVKPRSTYCAKAAQKFDTDAMFCLERARPGANGAAGTGCHHDSGSPLICSKGDGRPVLFGVIKGALRGHSACTHPGQATRVSHYVTWLHETIHALAGCEL